MARPTERLRVRLDVRSAVIEGHDVIALEGLIHPRTATRTLRLLSKQLGPQRLQLSPPFAGYAVWTVPASMHRAACCPTRRTHPGGAIRIRPASLVDSAGIDGRQAFTLRRIRRLPVLGERRPSESGDDLDAAFHALEQIRVPGLRRSVLEQFFDGHTVLFHAQEATTPTEIIRQSASAVLRGRVGGQVGG